MLSLLGAQPQVTLVNGVPTTTYKYASGSISSPNTSSINQSALGYGVVGSYSSDTYNTVVSFFLSKGLTTVYAETMAALLIDMALMIGIQPQQLIESSLSDTLLSFSDNAYRAMNNLRDSGNQIGNASDVSNNNSLQRRQIRV